MFFCKKCGSLMLPKKKGSKNVMACSKCTYTDNQSAGVIKENIRHEQKDVDVVHEEIETLPVVNVECPKCGNDKAYFWEIQTRASDEPPTKFQKCVKCKHIWRDYK